MTKRVEDAPYGTPCTDPQKHDENVPELRDESIEEDSDEKEFPPEDVKDESGSQDSRFSPRGPADARAVSLNTARRIKEGKDQAKNIQSQSNSQSVSQKPSSEPRRQVDPKRYAK